VCHVAQIIVEVLHLIYFLSINARSEGAIKEGMLMHGNV
jgi:heme/copper-type cytochrome/quinol oxidase subunit 4